MLNEVSDDAVIKPFLVANKAEVKLMCITEYDEEKNFFESLALLWCVGDNGNASLSYGQALPLLFYSNSCSKSFFMYKYRLFSGLRSVAAARCFNLL